MWNQIACVKSQELLCSFTQALSTHRFYLPQRLFATPERQRKAVVMIL
jgi:hypothetical protein